MSNLTLRIDESTKREAEKLFESFGLSLSTAVKMFFLQAIREQAIPFEIRKSQEEKYNEYFNPYNMERLKLAMEQEECGEVIHKTLAELEAITNE